MIDKERFISLWKSLLLKDAKDNSGAIFKLLDGHYRHPSRKYHTWSHIQHCLKLFDQVQSMTKQPKQVEMALWFHDAIYTAGQGDNEIKSAKFFLTLSENQLKHSNRNIISILILKTTHRHTMAFGDDALMTDIDIAGIGDSWKKFSIDSKNLESELRVENVNSHQEFGNDFLLRLLDRPSLFCSDYFREKLELKARKNIHRYTQNLQ